MKVLIRQRMYDVSLRVPLLTLVPARYYRNPQKSTLFKSTETIESWRRHERVSTGVVEVPPPMEKKHEKRTDVVTALLPCVSVDLIMVGHVVE